MQTTKTITKRIWGVLLALCMLLSLMPMAGNQSGYPFANQRLHRGGDRRP